MLHRNWVVILAIVAGLLGGLLISRLPVFQLAHAQELLSAREASGRILVQGHGGANSSKRPPKDHMSDHFTLMDSPQHSFKIIPPGKRFVLTDMMLQGTFSVRQPLTVNIARANPRAETGDIMLQVPIEPGKPEQVHLCSGYVIPSGDALVAWTNAGIEPEQYVQVSVTGYLEDDAK